MASSFINPFCEDEDPIALVQPASTSKPPKKKREVKRKKATKKKEETSSAPKNPFDSSGSESEPETPPPASPPVKRRRLIITESEDESTSKPVRAANLRSFLSQRVASGYTSQSDPSKRGNYFFELRVYNSEEVEKIASNERWKHAICTLKLATNLNSAVWRSLVKLINDSKDELKNIQPILYPANEKKN